MKKEKLRELMPHQKEALKKFKYSSSLALFMEMRLGKSAVAIRWAKLKGPYKLIIAPLTTLIDWEKELKLENQKNIFWLTRGSNPGIIKDPGWYLINYERLKSQKNILSYSWNVAIADESTKIKNPKAQITKALLNNFIAKNKAILSGLPAPENPLDFFNQIVFVYNKFFGQYNYWYFRHSYFHQDWSGHNWVPNTGIRSLIKKEIHKLAYVLTRKDAKIGSKKIYERRHLFLNKNQREIYEQVLHDFCYLNKDGKEIWTKWAPVKALWLSRITGGFNPDKKLLISQEKMKEIWSLLQNELKNEKVIIWFRFNKELYIVKKFLKQKKIKVTSISGKTSFNNRKNRTHKFRNIDNLRVMLCQIKCGKYGIDWSVASTAIYYSNGYSMEDRAQSEDRIVHPIKKEPLLYIDLITKDTIDEDVIEILTDKKIEERFFMKELFNRILKRRKDENISG